ncbi:MAG: hypothetical protein LLF98_11640 [Clostridium sp.]|uniref:hypothetical protein n=1 Tax=Clostridium sp. TaxID=1506 RepID=UPI0025C7091F|nr:hypothetical protein [Clostridium sp.]MCE5221881.1 hypothetical protein [Clostridium sp.]
MKVHLVKRGKIVHVGFKARVMGDIDVYSACNQRMDVSDTVSIGEDSEVTCKRCLKKISKADEHGRIVL